MSLGDLAGDPAEHYEDPRLPGRDRGRGRAASPGAAAGAEVAKDPVLQARAEADPTASWTPDEIAGRLRLEAAEPTVGRMANSPDAQGPHRL